MTNPTELLADRLESGSALYDPQDRKLAVAALRAFASPSSDVDIAKIGRDSANRIMALRQSTPSLGAASPAAGETRVDLQLESPDGDNGEAFKDMSAHIWAAGASLEDADFITRMLARKGLYLFQTEPWKRCPSTHCERRTECASPRDCTVKQSPSPSQQDEREAIARAVCVTPPEDLMRLAEAIDTARNNYLNAIGRGKLAISERIKLENLFWEDKGTFAPALRLAAARALLSRSPVPGTNALPLDAEMRRDLNGILRAVINRHATSSDCAVDIMDDGADAIFKLGRSPAPGNGAGMREAVIELLEIEDARIATGAFKPNAEAQRRIDNARTALTAVEQASGVGVERAAVIEECAAIADRYDDCGGAFIAEKIRDFALDHPEQESAPASVGVLR